MFKKNHIAYVIVALSFLLLGDKVIGMAFVIEKNDKTYIRDTHGENWDVTQAMTLGFDPHGFQFGIGRNAIQPVDGSGLTAETDDVPKHLRVIGVTDGEAAHGYSVRKLVRHEIANTTIGNIEIAAAY
jgi:hypothetical protein